MKCTCSTLDLSQTRSSTKTKSTRRVRDGNSNNPSKDEIKLTSTETSLEFSGTIARFFSFPGHSFCTPCNEFVVSFQRVLRACMST